MPDATNDGNQATLKTWLKRGLMAAAAWKLFAPEVVPRFPSPQQPPLELPGRTVFVNGVELFVRETGPVDGPVMVLVHGWGDDSMVTFPRIAALLNDTFRIVMVDNRNNGKSDHVRGGYSVEDVANELNGVLDQLDITDATVFGFSMGGMTVQVLARTHPERVARVALSGTCAANRPLAVMPDALVRIGVGLLRAADRVAGAEISWLRTRYLLSVGAVAPSEARWAYATFHGRDTDLYWASADAIAEFDSRPWVGGLSMPSMVIITTQDQLMLPASQQELADLLPNPVVHLVAGRHEAPLTHADAYARHLRAFAMGD